MRVSTIRVVTRSLNRSVISRPTLSSRLPRPSPPPFRLFSSTPLTLKKSKAAAVRRSNQQKKDDDPETENKRGEQDDEGKVDEVVERTRERMRKTVDWAKAMVYEGVERGRGRVSPGMCRSYSLRRPCADTDTRVLRCSLVGYGEGYRAGRGGLEIVEFGGVRDGEGRRAVCGRVGT